MNKVNKARLILVQLEALQTGDFENRTIEQMGLVNELFRDAKELAESIIEEDDKKKAA